MGVLELLLAAGAAHAAFQLTVSLVVYPALAEVGPEAWEAAHDGHSRRIALLVLLVYGFVATACGLVLARGPYEPATLLALGGHALAGLTTALVAAPTHARLGRDGPTPVLVRRLLVSDRVRTLGALVGLAGAVAALA